MLFNAYSTVDDMSHFVVYIFYIAQYGINRIIKDKIMSIKTGFKSIDDALGDVTGGEVAVLAGTCDCDNLFLNILYNVAWNSKQESNRKIVYILNHVYLLNTVSPLFPSLSTPKIKKRKNLLIFNKICEKFEPLNVVRGTIDERLILTSVDNFMSFYNPIEWIYFNESYEEEKLSAIFIVAGVYTHRYLKIIKDIAVRLNVPVIMLAGVKDGIEHKSKYTPKISDIKNYKTYARYADKFMIMYRETEWGGVKYENGFFLDKKTNIIKNKREKALKGLKERLTYWKNNTQIICYRSLSSNPKVVELNFCVKPVDDIFYFREIV